MKPVVGVLMLLLVAVVVTASAMVAEDADFGASYNENLELDEKERAEQTDVDQQGSQNALNTKDLEIVQPGLMKSRGKKFFRTIFRIVRPIIFPIPPLFPKIRTLSSQNLGSKRSQGANNGKGSCESTCVKELTNVVCVRKVLKICVKRATAVTCVQWSTKCSRSDVAELSAPVRSLDSQYWKRASTDDEPVAADDAVIQQEDAASAAMLAESQQIFSESYDDRVVKAEKYEFSSSDLGYSDSTGKKPAMVVLSLTDGRRIEVIQEPELMGGKLLASPEAYDLTNDWKMVESKDIKFSRVIDYARASDSSVSNEEAVDKMMKLD